MLISFLHWKFHIIFGELQDPVCSTLLFCQTFTIPANIFLAGYVPQPEFFWET